MRKLSYIFLLFLLVSAVSARSPAGPEESLQLQVSQSSEVMNLNLVNNREIKASNISLDVVFEKANKQNFRLDELDGGDNYTFTVSDEDLEDLTLENISNVRWNVSGGWQENFSAVFDLLAEDEVGKRRFEDDVIKKPISPVTFSFRRNKFVIYEGELSKEIFLVYRPYSQEEIQNLNISVEASRGVNISKLDNDSGGGFRYISYSLNLSESSLEGQVLRLNFSAEYYTFDQGEESGLHPEGSSFVDFLDLMIGVFQLFSNLVLFSIRMLASILGI